MLFYVLLTVTVGLSVIYQLVVAIFIVLVLPFAAGIDDLDDRDLLSELLFSRSGLKFVWLPLVLIGTMWAVTIREARRRPPRTPATPPPQRDTPTDQAHGPDAVDAFQHGPVSEAGVTGVKRDARPNWPEGFQPPLDSRSYGQGTEQTGTRP